MGFIKNKEKFDKFFIGLFAGIFIPFISLIIFWRFNIEMFPSVLSFYEKIQIEGIYIKLISLLTITNLLAFYLFLEMKLYNSVKGVIAATFFFAFIVVILKFF
ncbi:MAG: hypothetical protein B6I24_08810 [Bacteroidetes bacterium 4572_128]|nr:MAG: hypothetical protein B6I24_08810 [Bacteroidetes bacterium 4572_128]